MIMVRHINGVWLMIMDCDSQQRGYTAREPLLDAIRRNGDPNLFVTNHPLEGLAYGNTSSKTDTCSAVPVTLQGDFEGAAEILSATPVHAVLALSRLQERMSYIMEAGWRHARDDRLMPLLSPFYKDPTERSLSMDRYLSRLPNTALARILELARTTLTDSTLVQMMRPSSSEEMLLQIAHWIMFFAAGRFGTVTRTWPASQKWCLT